MPNAPCPCPRCHCCAPSPSHCPPQTIGAAVVAALILFGIVQLVVCLTSLWIRPLSMWAKSAARTRHMMWPPAAAAFNRLSATCVSCPTPAPPGPPPPLPPAVRACTRARAHAPHCHPTTCQPCLPCLPGPVHQPRVCGLTGVGTDGCGCREVLLVCVGPHARGGSGCGCGFGHATPHAAAALRAGGRPAAATCRTVGCGCCCCW